MIALLPETKENLALPGFDLHWLRLACGHTDALGSVGLMDRNRHHEEAVGILGGDFLTVDWFGKRDGTFKGPRAGFLG
jgi:hypothetical protein